MSSARLFCPLGREVRPGCVTAHVARQGGSCDTKHVAARSLQNFTEFGKIDLFRSYSGEVRSRALGSTHLYQFSVYLPPHEYGVKQPEKA